MLCLAVWCALGGLMHEHSLRMKAAGVAELSMHTGDARTASAHEAGKLRGITLDALLVELFYPAGDETAKRQRG
ncbi:MAG: hypothetical protein MO853_10015 [Candidatus Protistobacter heckmanni]|nr:hypothetical protein [Candidatus Protistobacter heckmanni]